MYEIGDTYTATITVTDSTGTPVNAGAVVCTITLPDSTTATPAVANPSTGSYTVNYPIVQSGQHLIQWVGTGANAFEQTDVFNVAASPPGSMISLAEARKGLGFSDSNKATDEDLRMFIAAATPIMEDLIGPVAAKTHIETFDGGTTRIALMYPPVLSVTSVIEAAGSNYQRTLTAQNIFSGSSSTDAFGYSLDFTTGVMVRRAAGVAIPFLGGVRNIQVTYVAGRIVTGNQLLACRRLVKHLWQSEQQNYSPGLTSPEAIGLTPSGFAVPRAVIELCADSQRPQGLA
jgi:hypothetical protein